jgi:hypothetical protein
MHCCVVRKPDASGCRSQVSGAGLELGWVGYDKGGSVHLVDEEFLLVWTGHHLGPGLHEMLEVAFEEREDQVQLVVRQNQIL